MKQTLNLQSQSLEYWQTELWQVLRYHALYLQCKIEFSPAWGVQLYSCMVTYTKDGKTITISDAYGVNLWKRYKHATLKLHEFFGDKVHTYENHF